MTISNSIRKLRNSANLSQEEFAAIFDVTQQSVQKWESGDTVPELSKLIKISRYFNVSLDALILGNDNRIVEEMRGTKKVAPQYVNIHDWEFYSSNLLTEYKQCMEEGLDIGRYKDVFTAISVLPRNETKKAFGDILFDIVLNAPQRSDYPYEEPSDLESIRALRKPYAYRKNPSGTLESKIHGAWIGRVCGCLLGKPLEGATTDRMVPFLTETGNYPMHRYIYRNDVNGATDPCVGWPCVDDVNGMPVDDDTNYTVLYQEVIEKYGRDFTPFDVSRAWLDYQKKDAYCTAERVAFCNFVKGYEPPMSAIYKNPYREWIGAQIRGDYFGYINPGDPSMAAEMAWRDACISHTKNGIYGEMFVAAMLAAAAETNNLMDIILVGLAEIPATSRLYQQIMYVVDHYNSGKTEQDCFRAIHEKYDEHDPHDWCHTISNAMIVAAALLYGKGDFGRSICMAVETGFDTDCNGATVGSILGMANGIESIPAAWQEPVNDTLQTSIFGVGTVKISERAKMTMKHIPGEA